MEMRMKEKVSYTVHQSVLRSGVPCMIPSLSFSSPSKSSFLIIFFSNSFGLCMLRTGLELNNREGEKKLGLCDGDARRCLFVGVVTNSLSFSSFRFLFRSIDGLINSPSDREGLNKFVQRPGVGLNLKLPGGDSNLSIENELGRCGDKNPFSKYVSL